jgi:hypothetical protein
MIGVNGLEWIFGMSAVGTRRWYASTSYKYNANGIVTFALCFRFIASLFGSSLILQLFEVNRFISNDLRTKDQAYLLTKNIYQFPRGPLHDHAT